MAEQKSEYEVGDRILIKPARKGQILKIVEGGSGQNKHFAIGKWFGVRLTEKKGTSDGRYKNQDPFYFKCPANFGVFVQAKLIIKKLPDETFDFTNETSEIEAAKAQDDEKYEVGRRKLKQLKIEFKKLDTDGSLSLEKDEFVKLALGQLGLFIFAKILCI